MVQHTLGFAQYDPFCVRLQSDMNTVRIGWMAVFDEISCIYRIDDEHAIVFAFRVSICTETQSVRCSESREWPKVRRVRLSDINDHTTVDDAPRDADTSNIHGMMMRYPVFRELIGRLLHTTRQLIMS